jgi:hypothetical protein
MQDKSLGTKQADWRLPLGTTLLAAVVAFFCITVSDNDDAALLLFFGVAPSLLSALLYLAISRRGWLRLEIALLLALSLGAAWLVGKHFTDTRTTARWLLYSKTYKERTLAAASTSDGYLKHSEWDGWGFPGAGNTVEYIVFDPENALSTDANGKVAGQFNGIPCRVAQVIREESHWYVVRFYTGTDWDHCPG